MPRGTLRSFTLLLILALAASIAANARCVIDCIKPAVPRCHHHGPERQTPPPQACSAAMLPAESQAHFEAPIAAAPTPALEIRPLLAVQASVLSLAFEPVPPDPNPPVVLRI